jgi:hypothetical protein
LANEHADSLMGYLYVLRYHNFVTAP